MFEKNKVIFRLYLNAFIGICGVPDQNKNGRLQKTDHQNVVSDH